MFNIYILFIFFYASGSFSSGRSTSLVLDSGAYSTYATPVYDGYETK